MLRFVLLLSLSYIEPLALNPEAQQSQSQKPQTRQHHTSPRWSLKV